jgi:hypothetical protein
MPGEGEGLIPGLPPMPGKGEGFIPATVLMMERESGKD